MGNRTTGSGGTTERGRRSLAVAILIVAGTVNGCERASREPPVDPGSTAPASSPLARSPAPSDASSSAPAATSPPPGSSTTPTPDPWEAVASCPSGDRPWRSLLRQARREDRDEELVDLAGRLAAECPGRWEPLWAAGDALYRLQRHDRSREVTHRALDLARAAQDEVGVARTAFRLGWLARHAGELPLARDRFREALGAARAAERPDLAGHTLNGLATVLWATGDLDDARVTYAEAIQAFDRAELLNSARRARFNHATVLLVLGDTTAARRVLERLHAAAREADDNYLAAKSANAIGNVHMALREYEAALDWYARVPAQDEREAAFAGLQRGRAEMLLGAFDRAERSLGAVRDAATDPIYALYVDSYLAELDLRRGRPEGVALRLRPLIDEADARNLPELGWHTRWTAGRAALERREEDEAIELLGQAVDIIEGQGERLDPLTEGLRFLRARVDPYADLALALARAPRRAGAAAILSVVEKTHARALRRVLRDESAAGAPVDLARLQRSLEADELVLDYLIGEDRGVVLVVGRDDTAVFALPGWTELLEPLTRYRSALQRPLRSADARMAPRADLRRSLGAGRRVAEMLLGPVLPRLRAARRLYVIPDRDLALIPFAALPWPEARRPSERVRFLGERLETAILPLAGAPPRWTGSRAPMLLAGDPLPDAGGRFPALPGAAAELREVGRVWGTAASIRLARDELTPKRLLSQPLGELRTLHLSTHAVASTSDREVCAVYLSDGARLDLETIAALPLDAAPLVVLSACRTGDGELVPGEGVVGLGWAFLRAGARGVVVSLWSVEDTTAADLMVAFHRHLREGHDPTAALALAQRRQAADGGHPAYWSPFVLLLEPGRSER